MLRWLLQQIVLFILLFLVLIEFSAAIGRESKCLCVSLLLDVGDRNEYQILDMQHATRYSVFRHADLGQSSFADNGQLAVTFYSENSIHVLTPDNQQSSSLDGRYPVWSPDGHWLAYVPNVDNQRRVLVLDTHADEILTIETPYPYSEFIWSPDNNRVIYFVAFPDGYGLRGFQLYLFDLTRRIGHVHLPTRVPILAMNWSSDAKTIFVLTSSQFILGVDAETGELTTQESIREQFAPYFNVTNIRLSLDAEWLLFLTNNDELTALNVTDGRLRRVPLDVERVINAMWWQQER